MNQFQQQQRRQQELMRQQQEQMRRQQEQTHRQQELMRKQQEDMRRRQMEGAWHAQQRERAEQSHRIGVLPENFAVMKQQVDLLREQVRSGKTTKAEAEVQLAGLVVQDESGNSWTIGYETDKWYRHDGKQWVEDEPPRLAVPLILPKSISERHPRRFLGILTFLALVAITFLFGLLPFLVLQNTGLEWIVAGSFWLLGLYNAIRTAGRVWHGF